MGHGCVRCSVVSLSDDDGDGNENEMMSSPCVAADELALTVFLIDDAHDKWLMFLSK